MKVNIFTVILFSCFSTFIVCALNVSNIQSTHNTSNNLSTPKKKKGYKEESFVSHLQNFVIENYNYKYFEK